jgi:hypothetical protein
MAGPALPALSLATQAAGSIMAGRAAAQRAAEMRQQEKINAEWGRIRANQTDTAARMGLEEDLSAYRAVFSANDTGVNSGTIGLLDEARTIRQRDRRIEVGNRNREATDAERRAATYKPGLEMARGFMRAAPSLFQLAGTLGGR